MSVDERRRYFRVNDLVGLSIRPLDEKKFSTAKSLFSPNPLKLIAQADEEIETLLGGLAQSAPEVARLAVLLNQKIERVANLLALETELLDRIAERVQEVNISACGVAFNHYELLLNNTMLELTLTLLPQKIKLRTNAKVVHCEKNESGLWWCRVDFIGMDLADSERLIQHIVQSQNVMLKERAAKK